MSANAWNEERLGELLRLLRPAPTAGWKRPPSCPGCVRSSTTSSRGRRRMLPSVPSSSRISRRRWRAKASSRPSGRSSSSAPGSPRRRSYRRSQWGRVVSWRSALCCWGRVCRAALGRDRRLVRGRSEETADGSRQRGCEVVPAAKGRPACRATGTRGLPASSQPNPGCAVRHYNLGALTLEGEAGDIYEVARGIPGRRVRCARVRDLRSGAQAFSKESRIGFARCLGASLASGVSGSGAVVRVRPLPLSRLAADASGFRIDVRPPFRPGGVSLAAALVVMRHGRAIGVLSVIAAGSPWSKPGAAIADRHDGAANGTWLAA